MKQPENNDHFPIEEYQARINKLRQHLRASGLDAALFSTEGNFVYFTGFLNGYWICQNHDDTQLALITANEQEPVLMIPCHLEHTARTSCISDIRTWNQFDVNKGSGSIATVVQVLREYKLDQAKIGTEIGPNVHMGMPLPFLNTLKEQLPDIHWEDIDHITSQIRMIKSPLEIEKVRTACRISCEAFEVGLNAVKEGMSEKELGQIIACEMAARSPEVCSNHPWFLFIFATGRGASAYDGMATSYRFKKGDVVYIDGGLNNQGYNADMIRCISIGEPSAQTLRYYNATRDANMYAIDFMRPGVTCKQVYQRFVEKACELGFKQQIDAQHAANWQFLGHAWGMNIHDLPYLDGGTDDVLQPGMVFSVEGNIFDKMPFTLTTQTLKNEDNVVITEDGCELLTELCNDLWIANT